MVKQVEYKVRIRSAQVEHGGGDVPALLDMLRYDYARVVSWGREGDAFVVTLTSERVTPDRWSSFDIPIEVVR